MKAFDWLVRTGLLPLAIVVGAVVFLIAASIGSDALARKYGYHREQNFMDQCAAKGGIALRLRDSRMTCIRREAVIQ